MNLLDTIAAISTGHVNQAISIIRIVGPDSLNIIKKIFTGKIGENKTIQYGFIKDDKKILDEVLVSFFIGTDNFVGENTIEINAHGGIVITQKILELILSHGARLATNGEFTRRAFLNGKMSLIKAEAINDLINAKTSKQQEIAINSFNKEKEIEIFNLIKDIEYLIGLCEVNIDYPEYDDIPVLENKIFFQKLEKLINRLNKIVATSEANQVFIKPLSVVIVGNPNVGKSSLMNVILNKEKSIVTDIPGTTRDVIEQEIIFNNYILRFKDTAGIRNAKDKIEKIGIERSWNEINAADVVIHLIDATKGMNNFDDEIIIKTKNKNYIQLWNKSDLIKSKKKNINYISTLKKDIKSFSKELDNIFKTKSNLNTLNQSYNERQTSCLKKSLNELNNAFESCENGMTYDVVLVDLHEAWKSLKEILGNADQEDLLDSIFKNFCLGK